MSRGAAWAVLAAAVGFALPFVLFTARTLVRYYAFDYRLIDLNADFREMPRTLLAPAIGCALVFGLAAFLNYAPARRLGFVRALLFVGLAALGGLILMSVVTVVFDLSPQRKTTTADPWIWLRVLIAVIVPITYAAGHTAWRLWGPPVDPAACFDESVGGT